MYLRGEADAKTFENAVEIDRDQLIDQQEVFVVRGDSILRQVPVVIRKFNRQTAIVSGLPDGAKLLDGNVAGAYDGMKVQVSGEAGETAAERVDVVEPVSK